MGAKDPGGAPISAPRPGSAQIIMHDTVRMMKTYILTDTEWDNLTSINNRAIIYSSAAAGFLVFGAETIRDLFGVEGRTPLQELLLFYGVPAFLIVAVIFGVMSGLALWSRRSLRTKIDKQTTVVEIRDDSNGTRQIPEP